MADMQAVVVIYGMGEQIPMDTIKGFVDAVWQKDNIITANGLPDPAEVWSKPDARTGSLELRRITTRESIVSLPQFPTGVRTDFYELYWADLTGGATWDSLKSWVSGLLFRPLSRVPPKVRLAWLVLWLGSLLVVALGILAVLPASVWNGTPLAGLSNWQWLLAAGAVAIIALVHQMGTSTFGRVVRYTRADPDNIAARAAVRDRGLKLLRSLHDGPHYKRIVIVAHSLGTMLAHDLLSYFWAEREAARTIREGTLEFDALCALEQAAAQVALSPDDQADGVCPRAARVAPSALRPPGTGGQSTRSTLADQRSGDPGESFDACGISHRRRPRRLGAAYGCSRTAEIATLPRTPRPQRSPPRASNARHADRQPTRPNTADELSGSQHQRYLDAPPRRAVCGRAMD